MIISASRRTDIPAFFSDWFFNRISEGYVLVRNPMNYYQVSKIDLSPSVVDCIVFWTKDPCNMIDKLSLLEKYKYYFQFTLNSYDQSVECGVRKKSDIIKTFIELSRIIGKEKVIWRYDPILLSNKYTKEHHYKYFEIFASKLKGYTDKCVISFLDLYKNTQRGVKSLELSPLTEVDMVEIARNISAIANKYNIEIATCCERIDLSPYGIKHNKCIDDTLITKIVGANLNIEKDKTQREVCGCVSSIDIGAYNTCRHNCAYCYATYSEKTVEKNRLLHNPKSPLLLGDVEENDIIKEREVQSIIKKQVSLFD